MSSKIIPIAVNDIIADEAACSDMLTHACTRGEHRRVTGGGCDDGVFWAIAEEAAPGAPPASYRFARLCAPGKEEIAAAVSARYYAGFTTIAFFPAADAIWALFAVPGQAEA